MSRQIPLRLPLLLLTAALAGCGTFITPAEDEGERLASTIGGYFMEGRVTSTPTSAAIYLNGRPLGYAPMTARMEVNRDGDLVDDITLAAEFAGGSGAEAGGRRMEQDFTRGNKPPSAVSFNPGGSSALGR